MLLNARQLEHPDGRVPLILLAIEDVTERRRLEQALHLTLTELERSNLELEALATVASHDLQEPLRKIRAFGERLEAVCEGRLPEKGREYLARMMSAAARMQNLISDLLALARVTTRGATWSSIDLNTLVGEVLSDMEIGVARGNARVTVGALPTIEGDPTQLRQLFQNLIGNALKFRGTAASVVEISASVVENGFWRIDVVDNGIGFDPQYSERIFRPFERLHSRQAFDGNGIGLALCERIVRRHRGTIRAESTPGAGARFIVHIRASQKDKIRE